MPRALQWPPGDACVPDRPLSTVDQAPPLLRRPTSFPFPAGYHLKALGQPVGPGRAGPLASGRLRLSPLCSAGLQSRASVFSCLGACELSGCLPDCFSRLVASFSGLYGNVTFQQHLLARPSCAQVCVCACTHVHTLTARPCLLPVCSSVAPEGGKCCFLGCSVSSSPKRRRQAPQALDHAASTRGLRSRPLAPEKGSGRGGRGDGAGGPRRL